MKNKQEKISDILDRLRSDAGIDVLNDINNVEKYIGDSEQKSKYNKIIFAIFLALSLALCSFFIYNTNKLEEINFKLLREKRDSLGYVILGIDSNLSYGYYLRNGKAITYKQLRNEKDSLTITLFNEEKKSDSLRTNLMVLRNDLKLESEKYELVSNYYNANVLVKKNGNKYTLIVNSNKKIDTALKVYELLDGSFKLKGDDVFVDYKKLNKILNKK